MLITKHSFCLPAAIAFLCCFLSDYVFAQKVSGTVSDEKGNPLPLINVALMEAASGKLKTGMTTDSAGWFLIATDTGSYRLRITAIGFREFNSAPFQLATNADHDFGSITLKGDEKMLQNVSVTATRPAIVQLPDRLVVNIEGTAMAAGNSAFSVLAKSPGVFIDNEGNIQLNGRSGVTVMLDGRLTYLSARDLRNLLEGMPAENIRNIEIITNPSAKYDAEGTSGILNINLKKNTQKGINGSIYAGYNTNFSHQGYSYGASLNHKAGNWNSFVTLDGSRRVGGREATFTRVFYGPGKVTYFDQAATGNFWGLNQPFLRAGTDYTFNSRRSMGVVLNYNRGSFEDHFLTETLIGSAAATTEQFIDAANITIGNFKNFTANVHYVEKMDTLGSSFTTDVDYARIRSFREGNFYNYFTNLASNQTTKDFLFTSIPSGYDIYSGKMDYSRSFSATNKLEMGVKASHVVADNDSRFYFNNTGLVLDPLRTNHFNYKENIFAAYVNWSGRFSEKVSVQAGLRAEHTDGRGISYTTGQENNRNYLNLFPSLFIQQEVTENYGINYSYSRRLTRPNYGNLNPFRSYRDPYTWVEGNPYLRPQYTHSISVSQMFSKTYNVQLYLQLHEDVMSELPFLDVANATTVYTTGNVNDGFSVGMNAILPLKILKWWDSQNTMVVAFNKFSMISNNGPLENKQVFASLQSNHTLRLPASLRFEANVLVRGPAASGLYHMAAMSRVDLAVKRAFYKNKLELTVNATDVFKGYRFLWSTDINGNVNDFDQYLRWRTLGATLRYNFSKGQKVDTKRRNTTLEELNRT